MSLSMLNLLPGSVPCIKVAYLCKAPLTHRGRVTHICVGNLTIIGSDNGLSPGRRQAIIWTNAGILLIGPLGTNFSEILIDIHTFSFMKMHLKMSSAKWHPFCLGLNVLTHWPLRDVEVNLQVYFWKSFYKLISWELLWGQMIESVKTTPMKKESTGVLGKDKALFETWK